MFSKITIHDKSLFSYTPSRYIYILACRVCIMAESKKTRAQQASEDRIHAIQTIKALMVQADKEDKELPKERIVSWSIMNLGLSRRTALDYIKAAEHL